VLAFFAVTAVTKFSSDGSNPSISITIKMIAKADQSTRTKASFHSKSGFRSDATGDGLDKRI
jgi:hypothetical protein